MLLLKGNITHAVLVVVFTYSTLKDYKQCKVHIF